jgi:hypothetical protein
VPPGTAPRVLRAAAAAATGASGCEGCIAPATVVNGDCV